MIHAGLTVFRTVDGVPFTKLDLLKRMQFIDLPADEAVIIGICRSSHKCATPVNSAAECCVIFLHSTIHVEERNKDTRRMLTIHIGGKYANQ